MMTQEEAEQAVTKGEHVLDTAIPGWWREDAVNPIDLAMLRMSSSRMCVLGQSCPLEHRGFTAHAMKLSGIQDDNPLLGAWAAEHGFEARTVGVGDYATLRAVWISRITARRQATSPSSRH